MASALVGDDLTRSTSSRRSWTSGSFREVWTAAPDVFNWSGRQEEDEEELRWAAIERLPTYDRLRKGTPMLTQVLANGKVVHDEVDVTNLGMQDKKLLMESFLKVAEEDNEKFLRRLRDRTDRVGIEIPKIEVRYEHVSVEGDVYVGSRALPTLLNVTLNTIESTLGLVHLAPSEKRKIQILKDVSGIVKPSRMTLLLGPPGAGKTTLLHALAGKLDKDLKVSGKVTYCGHEFHEFVPQRTCAYISQLDLHHGEMTVGETLEFSGRCVGVGTRYEMLVELSRREKEAGIKPDPEIDAFMKNTAMAGQKTSLVTDYILKTLGLDTCADIMVGDEMRRGISGGQKKRVTTGEMLVGPAKALDSSTTFQICKYVRQMVHVSLLQPAPETFDIFDDIILLSEGQVVYQGVADFLQEVISKRDQEQYWFKKNHPYRYISVSEFAQAFGSFHIGQQLAADLSVACDKSRAHPAALVTDKYGISNWELFRACFSREWLLMKRNSFVYIFKTTQITIMTEMPVGTVADGGKFFGALFFSLVNVMFNGMAELARIVLGFLSFINKGISCSILSVIPIWVLRIPLSFMELGIWIILTYYKIGFSPSARFFRQFLAFFGIHQMALSLFRTLGTFTLLLVFVLGGFIVAKNDIEPWMIWGYFISPMMYGQNAIVMNEFLDNRWSAHFLDFLLFNVLFIAALTYLNPLGESKAVIADDENDKMNKYSSSTEHGTEGIDMAVRTSSEIVGASYSASKRGMVFPFQPLSLAFNHVNYYVGMPAVRILTALVGVSGAGKTTLMDVLAGRKTGGYIEGTINISGYPNPSKGCLVLRVPKNQATFARVSGYCEQNDIHSPNVTVYESLLYSAWLHFSSDNHLSRPLYIFICLRIQVLKEVMELVELKPIREALVGLPRVDAVELVANPSIIFMDEPTSGLDARAAAIVMRTVRNTVDTGRTVVCTIHQPSIDIFEAFDELLLMKRGGQLIYAGPLKFFHISNLHINIYLCQSVPGVTKIRDGYNPATWMLEVTAPSVEAQLDGDFADIYANSSLYLRNQELIKELSTPVPGSNDLYFPTKYSQPFSVQCKACFWKQHWSYWRNPQYNAVRFFMTIVIGALFGLIFWNKGQKTAKQQDLMNLLGAMYATVLFLGALNASAVQSVVAIKRTVFYRERAAGMYSALPHAFSQWKATKFLWFYYYIFTCFFYFTLYGMMVVALTPGHQIAAICMSFFLSFWNLFSGFLLPRPQIPIWWRWYYWASPVAWTLYGLVTSQVGDKNASLEIPEAGNVPLKVYLKVSLGFEYDFLSAVAVAHLGFLLLFFFVFAYFFIYLSFSTTRVSCRAINAVVAAFPLDISWFSFVLYSGGAYPYQQSPMGCCL
ncbi:hypothetical protein ACB098_03G069600 [Castanea mollissima]